MKSKRRSYNLENLEKSRRRNPDPALKKIPRSIKLAPDVDAWLKKQPNATRAIEDAVRAKMAESQSE